MRWTLSGLSMATVIGAGACLALAPAPAPAPVPADDELLTAKVSQGDLSIEVDLKGTFVAEDKDEIRIEPDSYRGDLIITQLKSEGQAVKKGDILIEFEAGNLEDSLEEAQDEVTSKQVECDKARADLQAFEIDQTRKETRATAELDKADKALKKAQAEAEIELADKKKGLEDAAQRVKDAEIDFEQLVQLYEERELHTATENILIARQKRQLENTRRGEQKTKKEHEIWLRYEQGIAIIDAQLDHDDKKADIEKSLIQSVAERKEKEAAVKKAERTLSKASEKVEELTKDKESLCIISPRDGLVFYGTIGFESPSDMVFIGMGSSSDEMKIGGRVRTHQVLMTVASMERLSVKMKALESDIQYLQEGLPIVVRPDAFPSLKIDGELVKVDQVASRQGFLSDLRQFTVRGSYEKSYPQLRSGMNCRVTVRADSIPDCLQVPVLAVFSEGGEHHCLVVGGGETSQRTVKIGATNGTMVEIQSGLRLGDTVALYNPASG